MQKGIFDRLRAHRKVSVKRNQIVLYEGHPYKVVSTDGDHIFLSNPRFPVHPADPQLKYNPSKDEQRKSHQRCQLEAIEKKADDYWRYGRANADAYLALDAEKDAMMGKIGQIAAILSKSHGDTYRGDNPDMDRVFDLLDDLLGITGKDRCDYGEKLAEEATPESESTRQPKTD